MKQVHSDAAKRRFGEFIDEVRVSGEPVMVLRYARPAVVIVPAEWFERARAALGENGGTP